MSSPVVPSRIALVAIAVVVLVVLSNAWVCDDAYITFRVADNVLAGHGPRWNVDERVQAYSNPLWLAAFTPLYALLGDAWSAALLLGVGCTATTLWLSRSLAPGTAAYVALCAGAAGSKAFVDYATSGLENPLAALLLVVFALRLRALVVDAGDDTTPAVTIRQVALLSLVAAALMINRLDAALLVAPALLALPWLLRRRLAPRPWLLGGALGTLPLLGWLGFAAFYYGHPLPNTAAAKLQTGWTPGALASQGLWYLADSLQRDPLTLFVVAAGMLTSLLQPRRWTLALAAGVALHLGYIVSIGGDFMSGRFLTAPLVLGALLLLQLRVPKAWQGGERLRLALRLLPIAGWLNPEGPIVNPPYFAGAISLDEAVTRYITPDDHGICDERAFYYPSTAVAFAARLPRVPDHPWRALGEQAAQQAARSPERPGRTARIFGSMTSVGYAGFYAGPQVFLVDRYALVDAFVASLPPRAPAQRIGHIERDLPAGYLESRAEDRDLLRDATLHERYAEVALRTRAPLLAEGRLAAIVAAMVRRAPPPAPR